MPPDALEMLRAETRGHQLLLPPTAGGAAGAPAGIAPQFDLADVAFGQPAPSAIGRAEHLKWIHISSAGITRYDNPEFRALMARRGIPVTNSSSVFFNACAVHALSFMLAQARLLPRALTVRTESDCDTWNELRGASRTLKGETVLIVGYGAIGRRLAELLRPFGTNLTAYRRQARGDETVSVVTKEGFTAALGNADHVVDILPDSAETRGFFGRKRFAAMKHGAVFYNIGRGATVDQDALLDALRSHRVRAAWLDVTEPEPLPDGHPLLSEPNCYLTPHIAGGQPEEYKALVRHFLDNLDRFVQGRPLLDRVM